MSLSERGYTILSLTLGMFLVVLFFLYALQRAYAERFRNGTVDAFLTARGRATAWRVGWAFFGAGMGAWVLTSPASYTPYAGMIGCVTYAFSAGAPLLLIAYLGGRVQAALPRAVSLTDFAGWRFGAVGRAWVAAYVCLNVGIALLAEYTTIGALFGPFLGVSPAIAIVVVGVLTTLYTSLGGLVVSIVTDQVQGAVAALLLLVIVIYVAVTFRFPLPHPMPCDPADPMGFCISGENPTGWGSLFSMPASLATATVFSEAMWQRVWAAESRRALRVGAWFGFAGVFLGVFATGLVGLLAAWAGRVGPETDGNLYLFAAFPDAISPSGRLRSWIGVVVLCCAAVMNESAVDSMQNGLTAALSGAALKDRPLWMTRLVVVAVNVPVMVVATRGYTIIQLFLLANIACATGAAPVLAGLARTLDPYYGGGGLVFSSLLAVAGTSIYGVHDSWNRELSRSENIAKGMRYAWMENNYNWLVFLVCICCSAGGVLVSVAFNYALRKLFRLHPAVWGLASPATHPELFRQSDNGETNGESPSEQKESDALDGDESDGIASVQLGREGCDGIASVQLGREGCDGIASVQLGPNECDQTASVALPPPAQCHRGSLNPKAGRGNSFGAAREQTPPELEDALLESASEGGELAEHERGGGDVAKPTPGPVSFLAASPAPRPASVPPSPPAPRPSPPAQQRAASAAPRDLSTVERGGTQEASGAARRAAEQDPSPEFIALVARIPGGKI